MPLKIKKSVLIVILPLMGAAIAMAISDRDDASHLVEVATNTHSPANQRNIEPTQQVKSDSSFDLSSIKRMTPKPNKNSDLFLSKSWYTAPPPPPAVQMIALPPPVPTAPPLPYTFSGRMIDGDQVILFLSRNGRQYTVKAGDVFDETYRLDIVTNINAVLTYLPLSIQQTLSFNSTAIGALTANEPQKNPGIQTSPPVSTQILQH